MPRFDYRDKNGESAIRAHVDISVDLEDLMVDVGLYAGDQDTGYTIYVPNHRTKIEELIEQLQAVLLASDTSDQPERYDVYCGNAWCADEDGNENCY